MSCSVPSAARSSVQEAAAAIVQLINTTPRTPWVSEIEAVIAKAVAPLQDGDAQQRLARIETFIKRSDEADAKAREPGGDPDDEADRIYGEFGKYCEAIWRVPPRSIIDLQERAAIAQFWHRMVDPWDAPDDCDDWGQRTIAELIAAVLSMGLIRGVADVARAQPGAAE